MTETRKPARIQRRRIKGWKRPLSAVIVDRTSRWGNPFVVGTDADDAAQATALYREWLENNPYEVHPPNCTPGYRRKMDDRRDWIITHAAELRGKDLACFCPLPAEGEPDHCHAAVLLELANAVAGVQR